MRMEIDIEHGVGVPRPQHLRVLVELLHHPLGRIDGRLKLWIWVLIEAIEVVVECVRAEIAAIYSIRVETRDDLEHKIFSEGLRLLIILVKDEIDQPI